MKKGTIYILTILSTLFYLTSTVYGQCDPNGVDLGNDTTLCQGENLQFDLSNLPGNPTVIWENGSTSLTRIINAPGTYSVETRYLGNNIVINGDFSQGNTGFDTDYILGVAGPWGPLSDPGTYAISTSPHLVHNNFSYCTDHTGTGGNMLIVNGADSPGTNVWCQTINVSPNTDYEFSTWITNALFELNVAQLQFSINGIPLGNVFTTSTQGCQWQQFFEVWNSGTNTTAQLCILNLNTEDGGNDFAIDDISFSPICLSTDTIEVDYAIAPSFTLPNQYNNCEGDILTLDAENPGGDFLWSTGENSQTIEVTTSGTYTVNVSDDGYCAEEKEFEVIFHTPPNAGNDADFSFCTTLEEIDLYTLLIDVNTETSGTWYNSQNNEIINGLFSFSQSAGVHNIKYVLSSDYCPSDTAHYTLDIKAFKSAGADINQHLCNEGSLDLNGLVTVNNPGNWESLDGLVINNSAVNLQDLPKDIYDFRYVVENEAPCLNDTAFAHINLSEIPNVLFEADKYEGCSPLTVSFTDLTVVNGNKSYQWLVEGVPVGQNQNFNFTFENVHCYNIGLEITADNLCVSQFTHTNMICVNPDPIADFNFSPANIFSDNPHVNFNNTSLSNAQNEWTFGSFGQSGEVHPSFDFPLGKDGNYVVSLVVTSNKGCVDSISKIIPIRDQTIYYVPNAFTPNSDEFNNIFLPIMSVGVDMYEYNLQLYNRWGECVFETNDFNEGWDGTYMGVKAKEGTYVWKIRFKEQYTTDIIRLNGVVNLLR